MTTLLAYLTDEDVHGPIVDGLRRHHPELDIVRAVDVGLASVDDNDLLDWAAKHGRVLVSHDVNTCVNAANLRVAGGLPMAGLIVVPQSLAIAKAISDLRYIAETNSAAEMIGATVWIPL
jgi:hypothetical protein